MVLNSLGIPKIRGGDSFPCANPSPESREAHPIAEGMDENHAQQASCPKEKEGHVTTEECGVRKLEQ